MIPDTMPHFTPKAMLTVLLLGLMIVSPGVVQAKRHRPCYTCTLNGPTSAYQGQTYSYYLTGGCTPGASSWICSNCVVQSYTSGNATITFNGSGSNGSIEAIGPSGVLGYISVSLGPAPPLTGGTIPLTTQIIASGSIPAEMLPSQPTGGPCGGLYGYQWYSSTDGVNYSPVSGADGWFYQSGALTTTTWFMRETICSSNIAWSNSVKCAVVSPAVLAPEYQWINYNTAPQTLYFLSNPSGGDGNFTYTWYGNYGNQISGASGTTYNPGLMTASSGFYEWTWDQGVPAGTNIVWVTVYPQLASDAITPGNQTIGYDSVPEMMSIAPGGGSGSYTYQWLSDATGSFQPISGAVGASYQPGSLTSTVDYEVVVQSNGVSVTSPPVKVTVSLPLIIPGTITPSSITIPTGTSPGILTCTRATGGFLNVNFTYQWQSSPDGNTWNTMIGDTGLVYNPGTLSSTTFYRVAVTSGPETVYCNPAAITIGTVSSDWNFIKTRDISKPGVVDTVTAGGLADPDDVKQVTQYYDGLGRPIQSVARRASPLLKDVVTMQVYDPFGREAVKYLPYTDTGTSGQFKTGALQSQESFNSTQYPNDQYYYGQVNYEASPLNRVLMTMPVGNSWVGAGRGVGLQYSINQVTDSVHLWSIAFTAGSLPMDGGTYAPGTLYKTVTTDEQGNQAIEYKDMENQVVLKKTQLGSTPGTAHVGWLCTYYIYDDLNHLRFVIPPRAVELINTGSSWNVSQSVAAELCFRYEYDQRNRMIIKKVPGSGETWMVYDLDDRQAMSQDSNLRAQHKWLFTRYDSLNRPDSTGLMTDPANYNHLSYHSGLAMTQLPYPNLAGYTTELLTRTFYDGYTGIASASGLSGAMATNVTSNANDFIISYNTGPAYAVAPTPHPITRGLVTGTMTEVLGTSGQYLYTESFYDDRAREIQTQGTNYTGGVDTLTTQYDFSGKPLRTFQAQAKPTNTAQYHRVLTKTNYDPNFRTTSIWKNIDGAASDQIVDTIQYNELGQIRNEYLGKDPSTGLPLDSMVYDYNVRGWMTGMNKGYLANMANHYFGMELRYDLPTFSSTGTGTTSALYNGNIAGQAWKGAGDGVEKEYDYIYDDLNRLKKANFSTTPGGTMNFSVGGADNSDPNNPGEIQYDANGNMQSMYQWGFKIGGSTTIDALTYTYNTNSNKLMQVYDAANDTASQLGDFHYKINKSSPGSTIDYHYDGNGNLTSDANKAIDTIVYNYLNLPQRVHMKGKGNILYTYDAEGTKLVKQVIDSAAGLATTTLYLDGFQYQRRSALASPSGGVDTLQFMSHEEGRARWAFHKYLNGDSAYAWEYDFAEKDHLGNTRMLLTQEKDTLQYVATMEAAYRATENALFYGIDSTCVPRPAGYPDDLSVTKPNDSVVRVNGNGPSVGPAIVLRVMAGDKIDLGVQYYYQTASTTQTPPLSPQSLLHSFASGLATLSPVAGESLSALSNSTSSSLLPALNYSISKQNGTSLTMPQAYLNWVQVDDNFQTWIAGSVQVGAAGLQSNGELQLPLAYKGLSITRTGFLYIYVSNSTPGWDVFFDNLSIKHYPGPILEENHYYPFGLTMAAISNKAEKWGYAENKYKYNGIEYDSAFSLDEYEARYRDLDPQTGRWWQIDPEADQQRESLSPYASMSDDPVFKTDPLGNADEACCKGLWDEIKLLNNTMSFIMQQSMNRALTGKGTDFALQALNSTGTTANGFFNTKSFGVWSTNPAQDWFGVQTQINPMASTIGQLGGTAPILPGGVTPDFKFAMTNDGSTFSANTTYVPATPGSTVYAGKETADMAKTGADLAGITQNTEQIPAPSGKAQYRVPDELTRYKIGEVKLVDKLHFSSQIKDILSFAQQKQIPFTLYVRGGNNPTRLTPQLQQQVDAGKILLKQLIPNIQ